MPDHFVLDKDGRIATLRFNRPEKRNPLNEEILRELEALLHQVRDDSEVRVMILTGTGNTFLRRAPTCPRPRALPTGTSGSVSSPATDSAGGGWSAAFWTPWSTSSRSPLLRSTAMRSAVAGRWPWAVISGSPLRKPSSGFPRSTSGCRSARTQPPC